MLGLVLVVCLGGGREASARLTGQARTDYFKWSIGSCLRSAAAAKDLLDIARADSSPAGIRRFCECMAGEEANRLSSRRSGDRFMAALRQALPVCLQTPLTIRP